MRLKICQQLGLCASLVCDHFVPHSHESILKIVGCLEELLLEHKKIGLCGLIGAELVVNLKSKNNCRVWRLLLLKKHVFSLDALLKKLQSCKVSHFVSVQLPALLLLSDIVQVKHKFANDLICLWVETQVILLVKIHNLNYNNFI